MKKLLLIVMLLSFSFSHATNWLNSMEEAKKLALATNKLIVVDFWASWCGPCKRMDKESWSDAEVTKFMDNFIPVKINISRDRETASKYNIRSIPDIFIMNGNGDIIHHNVGYMSKPNLMRMLKEYALETSFLQRESINYYKHKSYNTAFMLGRKYLDYSLYLKDNPRVNFLNLGERYLNESLELMEEDQANYEVMEQKIELMKLLSDLYSGRAEKVLKSLERNFTEDEIETLNKNLFYYINYVSAKSLGNKSKSEWLEKLTNQEHHEVYLKKAEILFAPEKV